MCKDKPGLFDQEAFYGGAFGADRRRARGQVLIQCPYLKLNRIGKLTAELTEASKRGVRICVLARYPDDWDSEERDKNLKELQAPMEVLQNIGVHVTLRKDVHEKIAVIDDEILWLGSLNILSHYNSSECMIRLVTRDLVVQAIAMFGLDRCAACSTRWPMPLIPTLPSAEDFNTIASLELLGKCVSLRRKHLQMSHAELARAAAVNASRLSKLEIGKAVVHSDTLHGIFTNLQVQLMPIPWHLVRTVCEMLGYHLKEEQDDQIAHSRSLNYSALDSKRLSTQLQNLVGLMPNASHAEWLTAMWKCISHRRRELEMSQAELAKLADVGRTRLAVMEGGKEVMKLDTLLKTLAALRLRLLPVPFLMPPEAQAPLKAARGEDNNFDSGGGGDGESRLSLKIQKSGNFVS